MQNVIDAPTGIDPVAFRESSGERLSEPVQPDDDDQVLDRVERGHVSLKIYNAAGQLVRTLVDEEQAPRPEGFSATWDGTGDRGEPVASGVYFYRLTATGFDETKKMVLLN